MIDLVAQADRAEQLVPVALRLAFDVRTGAGACTRRLLAELDDVDELRALAVVLAAAIDIDKTAEELYGWTSEPVDDDRRHVATSWTALAVRAAHAAYNRGENSATIRAGELEYRRRLAERRRLALLQDTAA